MLQCRYPGQLFALALLIPPQSAQRSVSFAVSIIALAASVALLYYGRDFFVTLIVSAVFAFILDPVVVLVIKLRIPRPAATAIVIGLAIVGVYLLGAVLWSQVSTLTQDLPGYTSRIGEVVGAVNDRLNQAEQKSVALLVPKSLLQQGQQIQQRPQEAMKARRRKAGLPVQPVPPPQPVIQEVRIHSDSKPFLAEIYAYASGYFHVLVMASFVPFLVYFMLSWRDHLQKSVLRIFDRQDRYIVGKSWSGIGDATRAYVLGNFFLWIFLSIVSAMAFFFLGVPYWPLVGPLSAFLSLVPYVGLALSVLPPTLAALAIPNKFKIVLTIMLITAGLHVLTMNFVYAKVIGRRVRLNPLVVTIALMFWGLVWGGVGLLLAVPITAAIKAVCENVDALEPYGQLLGD